MQRHVDGPPVLANHWQVLWGEIRDREPLSVEFVRVERTDELGSDAKLPEELSNENVVQNGRLSFPNDPSQVNLLFVWASRVIEHSDSGLARRKERRNDARVDA